MGVHARIARGPACLCGPCGTQNARLDVRRVAVLMPRATIRATPVAVGYAISSLQQGLRYTIAENVDTSGAARMGNFVVTVDDGSGNPPSSLLGTVAAAVDAVRHARFGL